MDWGHGQTLSSGSAVPEDGVVKSGTFSGPGGLAGMGPNLTSYTGLTINGVQVKSGGYVAATAGSIMQTTDYSSEAYFYVKKGDVVISYGSSYSQGTIYGNYRFYPLRKNNTIIFAR